MYFGLPAIGLRQLSGTLATTRRPSTPAKICTRRTGQTCRSTTLCSPLPAAKGTRRRAEKPPATLSTTAWAPVQNAEVNRPAFAVIENVPEFMDWILYPAWADAMQRIGYALAPHIVDCADLGVPQHRVRLFMVCSRSKAPLHLQLPRYQHVPAREIIDFDAGKWSPINKPGRAASTLTRVKNGRERFGERFVMPYYGSGSGLTGRSLDRPIGTITTLERWAVVDGDMMRMTSADEAMAAQSFPKDTLRPDNHKLTMHMTGNAVPPLAGQRIIEALKAAA